MPRCAVFSRLNHQYLLCLIAVNDIKIYALLIFSVQYCSSRVSSLMGELYVLITLLATLQKWLFTSSGEIPLVVLVFAGGCLLVSRLIATVCVCNYARLWADWCHCVIQQHPDQPPPSPNPTLYPPSYSSAHSNSVIGSATHVVHRPRQQTNEPHAVQQCT